MVNYQEAVKQWDLETLEVALADAAKRAKDGLEINNLPYVQKQLGICKAIQDEILVRKIQQY